MTVCVFDSFHRVMLLLTAFRSFHSIFFFCFVFCKGGGELFCFCPLTLSSSLYRHRPFRLTESHDPPFPTPANSVYAVHPAEVSTFAGENPPMKLCGTSAVCSRARAHVHFSTVHSVLTRGRRSGSWLGPPNIAVAEETRLCLRAEEVAGCPSHRY